MYTIITMILTTQKGTTNLFMKGDYAFEAILS